MPAAIAPLGCHARRRQCSAEQSLRARLQSEFGGTGVETVLDQFFDDTRGPLYHFARGDLVG